MTNLIFYKGKYYTREDIQYYLDMEDRLDLYFRNMDLIIYEHDQISKRQDTVAISAAVVFISLGLIGACFA